MDVKRHCQWFVKNLLSLFNKMNITKSFECCCLYRSSCIIFFFSFHCYFLCVTLLLFRFSNGSRSRKLYFGLCEVSNVAKVEISWFKEIHRVLDHWSSRWVASRRHPLGFVRHAFISNPKGRLRGGYQVGVWTQDQQSCSIKTLLLRKRPKHPSFCDEITT